jgi:hypothetical protein
MLTFTTPGIGGKIAAGLVPLSDKFGDTLYSGDWDFNPLALAYMNKFGVADVRLGTGKLMENSATVHDDVDVYLGDVEVPLGNGGAGVSVYVVRSQAGKTGITALVDLGDTVTQYYYGIRASQDLGIVKLNGFLVGNSGTIERCAATFCSGSAVGKDIDNTGFAGKIEGAVAVGPANVGVMFIMTSGDGEFRATDSASSFITPMALIDHHGYWGYTGKLNIQGPTDTGIDDPVRIDGSHYGGSGLGFGLTTVQAKADFPIMERLAGYVAVGFFQNNDVPAGKEKTIGTDVYAQAKYNIVQNLNLEAGVDVAQLDKNNPVYNSTEDNTISLFFARLQLEY